MNLAHDQSVHWVQILRELHDAGFRDADIAKRIGGHTEGEKIRKWRTVRCQPRHDDGERLLAMWSQVMRKPREAAPLISVAEDFED